MASAHAGRGAAGRRGVAVSTTATVDDVRAIYVYAWARSRGITVYGYGSREGRTLRRARPATGAGLTRSSAAAVAGRSYEFLAAPMARADAESHKISDFDAILHLLLAENHRKSRPRILAAG